MDIIYYMNNFVENLDINFLLNDKKKKNEMKK